MGTAACSRPPVLHCQWGPSAHTYPHTCIHTHTHICTQTHSDTHPLILRRKKSKNCIMGKDCNSSGLLYWDVVSVGGHFNRLALLGVTLVDHWMSLKEE